MVRGEGLGDRFLDGHTRLVADLERPLPAWHVDNRTAIEKGRHAVGVQRRRHHDDAEIRAGPPGLLHERQAKVRMQAPLVKLVDDDGDEIAQERILLQPGGQDTLSRDEQARLG